MQQDRIAAAYGGTTNRALRQGYGLGWWIDRSHPGVVADIGLYGATPWLDVARGYGAMILIEGNSTIGAQLGSRRSPFSMRCSMQPAERYSARTDSAWWNTSSGSHRAFTRCSRE